jgi:hypothetical protein
MSCMHTHTHTRLYISSLKIFKKKFLRKYAFGRVYGAHDESHFLEKTLQTDAEQERGLKTPHRRLFQAQQSRVKIPLQQQMPRKTREAQTSASFD